jgi:hypothetical protein
MSKEIYEWDATAAANDFLPADGGWPEAMSRKNVNNAAREDLSTLRRWHDDMEWQVVRTQGPDAGDIGSFARLSTTQFTITLTGVDLTSFFPAGRLLQITDGGGAGVDIVTQVVSSSYDTVAVTTVNTSVATARAMDVASSDVLAYFSKSAGSLALEEFQSNFFVPESADDVGIQAAIDDAVSAGGGTVLLTLASYTLDASITMTGNGVKLLASVPEAELVASNGADLDQLLILGGDGHIEGVKFNGFDAGRAAGNGYGIRIDTTTSPSILNCVFASGLEGIHLSSATVDDLTIQGCVFGGIENYHIKSEAATELDVGAITGCHFNMSSMVGPSPAVIYVSGWWTIANNVFFNGGAGAFTPRAIWLWNETGTDNGGRRCAVTGNSIDMDNGLQGTAIEVGGRDCSITGNSITVGAQAVGIDINSITGGQIIDGNVVSGNSITGGLQGIKLNSLTSGNLISGNLVADAATAIWCESQAGATIEGNHLKGGSHGVQIRTPSLDVTVKGNTVTGASVNGIYTNGAVDQARIYDNTILGATSKGIQISATSTNCFVVRNHIDNATTGIEIVAGADATIIRGNHVENFSAAISDLGGTLTNRYENSFDPQSVCLEGTSDAFTDLSGLLPCGGLVGRYRVTAVCWLDPAATFQVDLHVGPNGTSAGDPIIHSGNGPGTGVELASIAHEFTLNVAGLDTDWTLKVPGAGTTATISATCEKIGTE